MKSPLRSRHKTRAAAVVKQLIPPGSVVDSFLLFSGEVECSLAKDGRFVCAHANHYVIYEFWKCVLENPRLIADIVISVPFTKFLNKKIFHILQENWPLYKDPYVRSALLFLLNRCSSTGALSSGEFDLTYFTPTAISTLRNFSINNFHLTCDDASSLGECILKETQSEYMFIPMPAFAYNFFIEGHPQGHEEVALNHYRIKEKLNEANKKWIISYPIDKRVIKLYAENNIRLINEYGNPTTKLKDAREIIVTNF
jgi:hypothetical protein